MTDSFVRDDVLEAVLRSRAGDGAPADLRAQILAAVAADGPRVAGRRRAGGSWRLLAVAVVSLVAIGTALFAGMPHTTEDPRPSFQAIVPRPTASPTPRSSAPATTPPPEDRSPSSQTPALPATVQACTPGSGSSLPDVQSAPWDAASGGTPAGRPRNGLLSGVTGIRDDVTLDPTGAIVVLDPSNGTLRRLVDLAPGVTGRPTVAWSPTGGALAFSVGGGSGVGRVCSTLYVIKDERLVEITTIRGGIGFSWAPDGASIAVNSTIIHSDGTTTSLAASCPGGCMFQGIDEGSPSTSPWSPDGRHLAVVREGSSLLATMSVATGEISDVSGSKGLFAGWLDPRRVRLVKGSANGPGRWADVSLDGAESKADVGVTTTTASRLFVSPDFNAAAGSACLQCPFVVAGSACVGCPYVDVDGGPARSVWTGKQPLSEAWSPDSRWIAFSVRGSKAKTGTWIVRADGTGLRRISTTVLGQLAWGAAER